MNYNWVLYITRIWTPAARGGNNTNFKYNLKNTNYIKIFRMSRMIF